MKRRTLLQSLGALACAVVPAWAHANAAAALQTAITRDNYVTVRKLLQQGVDPNSMDDHGRPALVKAMQIDSLRVVDVLLQAPGIRINDAAQSGETALMHACIKGHVDMVQRLLALGAKVNQPGWTPLHYAASADMPDSVAIAKLLLEQHAYIDAESPNKSTPLMLAAQYGSESMVQLLLEAGADAQLRNQLGLSAVDFAQRSERDFMVKLMERAFQATRPAKAAW